MIDAFVPSARSKVKRLPKRGHYDRATVHAILDAGFICHVGYAIGGQPFVTPTAYWREGDAVYWHGSSASGL
jgi:nitroimidazol reductase NimA-like FMN-containing flavoprotein (pyridoxamine 5'-phosphate oxidase superfamily)